MAFFWQKTNKSTAPRYRAKHILNKSEEEFFKRLVAALPDCYIFPQVAMLALLEAKDKDLKRNTADLVSIAHKRVDFAVYDTDLKLICVVDLSDNQAGDYSYKSSDGLLESAGVKTIHWSPDARPTSDQISKTILPLTRQAPPKRQVAPPREESLDTVQMIYAADPIPSNIKGLTLPILDQLTPNKALKNAYPHIWQRICLFAPEPKHLQKYLSSLAIQDRGETRAGFSIEVLREISDIQTQNDRYLMGPVTGWQPSIINR
ncbi:hypothetical protein BH11PSE11_BH11PSE11_14380 [soil metagenome]